MSKKIKTIAISIGVFLGLTITAYAATGLFFSTPPDKPDWEKAVYISLTDVFPESGEIGPGESKSINPVITSCGTVDMYCFIRVVMPLAPSGTAGLYNLNVTDCRESGVVDGWSIEESGVKDGKFVTVYRWEGTLPPGEQTTPLATQITMVDMGDEEFAGLGDINVEVVGYACSSDEMSEEDAWSAISQKYGV